MRPTAIFPAACVAAALAAIPAEATEPPCFCLQDAADRIWYDCTTRTAGANSNPVYDCFPSWAKERREVRNGHTLTRVEDGTPPCKPCRSGVAGPNQALGSRDAGVRP